MTWTASVDGLLDDEPDLSSALNTQAQIVFLGLALGSWVLGEALMAPVLHPLLPWLWLEYGGCFFIFTAWYFRVSRLFDTPWTAYSQALPAMIWALTPLHGIFPVALLCVHAGLAGMVIYEIAKGGVILAVLSRLIRVFQYVNHWPRWSALALALSPLAVAFAGVIAMVSVGGLAVVALGLNALHH